MPKPLFGVATAKMEQVTFGSVLRRNFLVLSLTPNIFCLEKKKGR